MTSATSSALRPEKTGTRATMPQVTTNSRRWITSAKAVAMMPTGSAISVKPVTAVRPASTLPAGVTGTVSP